MTEFACPTRIRQFVPQVIEALSSAALMAMRGYHHLPHVRGIKLGGK